MNFEVRGGKVYKEPGCQSLGSNWERIESGGRDAEGDVADAQAATGKELKVET